jgi:hypothetical protein
MMAPRLRARSRDTAGQVRFYEMYIDTAAGEPSGAAAPVPIGNTGASEPGGPLIATASRGMPRMTGGSRPSSFISYIDSCTKFLHS